MSGSQTFTVKIWISHCCAAEAVDVADAATSEATAIRRWQRHDRDHVVSLQTIISAYFETTKKEKI